MRESLEKSGDAPLPSVAIKRLNFRGSAPLVYRSKNESTRKARMVKV